MLLRIKGKVHLDTRYNNLGRAPDEHPYTTSDGRFPAMFSGSHEVGRPLLMLAWL